MDYRGLSVIGVWVGTLGISALFLMFDFTTDFIMALVLAAILLTVYLVRLKPGGAEEIEKFADQLEALSGRLSAVEGKVDEINKLLEE
jgi:hypothetical protein